MHTTSSLKRRWLALLRRTWADYAVAAVAAALAFGLYARTLAPGVLGGDSGEFQFAAWVGGFVHPTGYPLYLLLGWLWTHALPWGDPAWRMNLFSALWGGVAVGLLALLVNRLLRSLTDSPLAAGAPWFGRGLGAAAGLLFAVTPTFWSQAVVAEVYTLHAALLVGLLLVLHGWAVKSATNRARAARLVAGVAGLGLAHHRTTLLFLPGALLFVWLLRDRAEGQRLKAAAAPGPATPSALEPARSDAGPGARLPIGLLLAFAAPLLLYLLIPLAAPHAPYARLTLGPEQTLTLYVDSLAGFLAYISGSTFGGALAVPADGSAALRALFQRWISEFSPCGSALGLIGVIALALRRDRRARAWLGLTLAAFGLTVGFNLSYAIGDIQVFYIPAFLIWTLWVAAGVSGLVNWLRRFVRARGIRFALAGTAIIGVFTVACVPALGRFAALDQSQNRLARDTWGAILAQPLPQDAILLSNDRDELMPLWYAQYVEGRRPDLLGLFPLILPGPDWADVGQVAGQALASGRPVYAIKPLPGLEVAYGVAGPVPGSPLTPIQARAERPPDRAHAVDFDAALRLTGYDIAPAEAVAGADVTLTLYWQPQRPLAADYTSFGQIINAAGQAVGQSDHQPGGVFYPTSLWRPGDTLRDIHRITLAADLGSPPYAIVVGLYTEGDGGLAHLGQPQRIGWVLPPHAEAPLPAGLAPPPASVFAEQVALLGHQFQPQAGGVAVTLYWQTQRLPAADYAVFAHLIQGDAIVAQYDGPPGGSAAPTGGWLPGQRFSTQVTLVPPAGVRLGGVYQVRVGLYDPVSGARLAVQDAQGGLVGDSIVLGEITITP